MNRRKTLVVNPKQQKKLIMTMSLIPALGLSATMVLVCFFCNNLFQEATKLDVHLDSLIPLFLAVSGFVLVSGFFLLSNSLVISHRIAGPTYRLCKSIEKIREGDLAFEVSLRKGDYLGDVQDELNALLKTLNDNPPQGFRTRAMRAAEEAAANEATAATVDQQAAIDVADAPSLHLESEDAKAASTAGRAVGSADV